jgi:hypothetical protein
VEKKPLPQKSASSRAAPEDSLSATVDHSSGDSAQQQLTAADKKKLRKEARGLFEEDWFAPAGSVQEKQILRRWARRGRASGSVSDEDLQLIKKWLNEPDGIRKGRGRLFVQAAKKRVFGEVVFETAMERHKKLDDQEWLVAYFTAHGYGQKKIANLIHIGERMVDQIIRDLKDKIIQELDCDVESLDRAQIACWFFGL